jgi:hypothetical protein
MSIILVEWISGANAPFSGFADYSWLPRLRAFFYLMAMFNILLIRYVIMRIYIAPGHISYKSVVDRLRRAGISSVLLSCLPCVFGFILFILAGDLLDFYLLFGLSVIYCTIYFPRYNNWVSLIEENLQGKQDIFGQ